MDMNFCRRCGAPFDKVKPPVYTCENRHTIYVSAAPTTGIFFFDDDNNIVLSIRGIEPSRGLLDSIGGFVDDGETFEEAAVREIAEETGLLVNDYGPLTYLTSSAAHYLYEGESRSILSVFFYAKLRTGVTVNAFDDVASIIRVPLNSIDDKKISNDDVRAGLAALREKFGQATTDIV